MTKNELINNMLKERIIRANIGERVYIMATRGKIIDCVLDNQITNKPFEYETPIFYVMNKKLYYIIFKDIINIVNYNLNKEVMKK